MKVALILLGIVLAVMGVGLYRGASSERFPWGERAYGVALIILGAAFVLVGVFRSAS